MSKIASYSNQSTLVIVGLVLVLSIAIVLSLYKKEEFNLKNLQQKSWEKNLKNHD
jgi:LPXTG-motif cell wall-anchored protein